MKLLNTDSGIVHNATKICDHGVGERYKLSCGDEVYVGMTKGKYAIVGFDVTCKNCLRKEEQKNESHL